MCLSDDCTQFFLIVLKIPWFGFLCVTEDDLCDKLTCLFNYILHICPWLLTGCTLPFESIIVSVELKPDVYNLTHRNASGGKRLGKALLK